MARISLGQAVETTYLLFSGSLRGCWLCGRREGRLGGRGCKSCLPDEASCLPRQANGGRSGPEDSRDRLGRFVRCRVVSAVGGLQEVCSSSPTRLPDVCKRGARPTRSASTPRLPIVIASRGRAFPSSALRNNTNLNSVFLGHA